MYLFQPITGHAALQFKLHGCSLIGSKNLSHTDSPHTDIQLYDVGTKSVINPRIYYVYILQNIKVYQSDNSLDKHPKKGRSC